MFAPTVCLAQGALHQNTAQVATPARSTSGFSGSVLQPIPSAIVTVCSGSTLPAAGTTCSPTTTIYSNIGLTTVLPNPTNADTNGNYTFYATAGQLYVISVGGTGATTYSYVWTAPFVSGTTIPNATNATNLVGPGAVTGTYTLSGTEIFTGPFSVNAPSNASNNFLLQNPGVFTNTAANLYVTSALNGINIGTEFSSLQGGSHQTDAISGGVSIPVGALVLGANGLAGYAVTSADSASRTRANAVSLYGQCRNAANNSACWGSNTVVFDATGLTGHNMSGNELDMNLLGSPAFFKGFYLTGLNQGGTLPASATGFEIATPYKLPNGFLCGRASCTNGVTLDGLNAANPTVSQQIIFRGYDAGGVLHASGISGDSAGNIFLQPDAGSAYVISRNGGGIGLAGSVSGTATLAAPATGGVTNTLPSTAGTLSVTVASGTAAMTTAAIAAGAYGATVPVSATGVATTDVIIATSNAQRSTTNAPLQLICWPTANNMNCAWFNPTAASITPTAETVNLRVTR